MPVLPALLALVLALVSVGYGLGLAWYAPPPELWPNFRPFWRRALLVAGLAALAAVLLTLPTAAPFAAGGLLGSGLAFGALVGLLAMALLPRLPMLGGAASLADSRQAAAAAAPVLTLFGLAAAGLALVLLAFWGYPGPALYGYALGLLVVGVVVRLCLGRMACLPDPERVARAWSVEAFTLFGATAAAATLLSVLHFDSLGGRSWWAACALAASLVPFSWAIVAGVRQGLNRPALGSGSAVGAALVFLVGVALVSVLYLGSWLPVGLAALGLVSFWLVLALLGAALAPGLGGLVGALLVVALLAASFRLLAGVGEGLALIAGWTALLALALPLPEGASLPRPRTGGMLAALAIGLVALAFRLLAQRADAPALLDATYHYAFIGIILGALVPLIAGHFAAPTPAASSCRLRWAWPALFAGLLAVLAAPVLMLTWGYHAVFGLMGGLVAALALGMGRGTAEWPEPTPLVVAAMALVAGVAAPLLAAFELTRLQRAYLLGAAILLSALLVVVSLAWHRREQGSQP